MCSKGQEPFVPGAACYSILLETPQGWQRQDLCEKCWLELQTEHLSSPIRNTWKTQIPRKLPIAELPKHKEERALALLKLAIQQDSLEDREEAFFLALYLMRKKILCFRQEIDQFGEKILLYEIAATEEIIPVKKVNNVAVELVRDRLASKLKIEAPL
jgi:hypothetical protein